MPNSPHNHGFNTTNSNNSIKHLEQEFAELGCFSSESDFQLEETFLTSNGNTFKALNFASFESSNTAVYRSVKLGYDNSLAHSRKSFDEFGTHSPSFALGRSGTDACFADSGFHFHAHNGTSPDFLARASSCSLQKQFSAGGKATDFFATQPVTCSKTKEACNNHLNVKVQSLLWRFNEYSAAMCHGFTSVEVSELQGNLEKAFKQNDIDFSFKTDGEFGYDCQSICDCVMSSFSIVVSRLQSACQKIIGEKYVVEVIKLDCESPMTWERIIRGLMTSLGDCVHFRRLEKQQKCVFSELFSENRSVQNRADQLKHTLAPTQNLNLLTSFIDFMSGTEATETQIKFAEVYASLSANHVSSGEQFNLREGDIDKLLAILALGNFEVNRCVCILVKNTASSWFQSVDEVSRESIFKSLVRIVNIVGDSSEQLSLLPTKFQKEAIGALISIRPYFAPSGFTKEMAKIMFNRCATSKDNSLAKCADDALKVYELA